MTGSSPPHDPVRWERLGIVVVIVVSILWLARWPQLPLFLDSYYHLLTMQGFLRAGGVVLHDYWEFVPVGRPHLYPPLFHIGLTLLAQLHLSPLTIGRLTSWCGLPLLLTTLWCVGQRLCGAKTACFWLMAALMPYTWVVESAITTPATLALVLIVWLWLAVERGRWLAASLLLGGLWYLHLGLPWMAVLTCGFYSLWAPQHRRRLWWIIGASVIMGSPWLWHVWRHRAALGTHARYEDHYAQVYPILYFCAAWGLWLAWRAKGAKQFVPALFLGFLPLAWVYNYRWVNAQGMLPVVLAAGLALEAGYDACRRFLDARDIQLRQGILLFACAGLLWSINPALGRAPASPHVVWSRPFWQHLFPQRQATATSNEICLYSPWTAQLVSWVQAHTSPQTVLWSDLPYTGGLVGALTNRVIANAMLYEVRPDEPVHPLRVADTLLYFKDPEHLDRVPTAHLTPLGFHLMLETEMARIYQRPGPPASWRVAPAVCPLSVAWLLVGAWCALIVWDLKNRLT